MFRMFLLPGQIVTLSACSMCDKQVARAIVFVGLQRTSVGGEATFIAWAEYLDLEVSGFRFTAVICLVRFVQDARLICCRTEAPCLAPFYGFWGKGDKYKYSQQNQQNQGATRCKYFLVPFFMLCGLLTSSRVTRTKDFRPRR